MRSKKNITHDILQEKIAEAGRLEQRANDAVDLVTRTMNELDGINQQIDTALSEIDTYSKELEATRVRMSKQRSHNAAIMSNFAKLLDIGTEEGAE